jgi:hypothetical protein
MSCKSKKKKHDVAASDFIPVTSYLKGELARLDTSLAPFYKVETTGDKSDTVPIKNSEVKYYAKDFLELPDITTDKLRNDYEINHLYDELQEAFVFMFTTAEDHPVKREDVTVDPQPNEQGKNNIRSVFIELWQKNGDTTFRKNMMWESGKRFEITTIAYIGETEKNKKLQVFWKNFENPGQ